MNQDVLPPSSKPQPDYRMRDRLNGWTTLLPCRFLEWSSWYNQGVRNRLIGHYRLYQLFKKNNEKIHPGDISIIQSYILQYRTTYPPKHFVARFTSLIYSSFTSGHAPVGGYAAINRHLIYERPDILQQFLIAADTHFDNALDEAIQQISAPDFLSGRTTRPDQPVIIQYNDNRTNIQYNDNRTNIQYNDNRSSTEYHNNHTNEYNDRRTNVQNIYNHTSNQNNSRIILQPTLREGAQGKEKGVFSKKQLFIFFDLLAEPESVERIDFSKPAKFREIANLFHAISGKSASSVVDELNDHRNKSLYKCNTPGECDQLIVTLTNLASAFRDAGFRSIAKKADKKIGELEAVKKRLSSPDS
jgi:hypothetical protein